MNINFEISDETMGVFLPIALYWIYSGALTLLEYAFPKYKMHTTDDRNLVSRWTAVKGTLLQQSVQAIVAALLFLLTADATETPACKYCIKSTNPSIINFMYNNWMIPSIQFATAMLVMDTWQYFIHRYMHNNKFLYKHIHSHHHRLVVPYAYGALYNHPLEGLLVDTMGGAISFLVSGISPRASIFFFSFATIKAVDDHSGLWIPWNPFHVCFKNNSAYHAHHHELQGAKHNFSQPFFVLWDRMLGTYYMPQVADKNKEKQN